MEIITLSVGTLGTNCYILVTDSKVAVIDPGGESGKIIQMLEKVEARCTEPLHVQYIFNTHCHYDHVMANNEVAEHAKKSVYIHVLDKDMLEGNQNLFPFVNLQRNYSLKYLKDRQTLSLGDEKILVIHTPGHTRGSISLLVAGNLFCGDLLFKQSIGRTDLEGGSLKDMKKSLKKILTLDKKTIVYPGHGHSTILENEAINNPYVQDLD